MQDAIRDSRQILRKCDHMAEFILKQKGLRNKAEQMTKHTPQHSLYFLLSATLAMQVISLHYQARQTTTTVCSPFEGVVTGCSGSAETRRCPSRRGYTRQFCTSPNPIGDAAGARVAQPQRDPLSDLPRLGFRGAGLASQCPSRRGRTVAARSGPCRGRAQRPPRPTPPRGTAPPAPLLPAASVQGNTHRWEPLS